MTPATLGYVIRHVPDVTRSARFYQAVFGLTTRLIHESGSYIELDTGTTTLAFATPGLIRELGVDPGTAGRTPPFGTELAFVVPDAEVEATVARAVSSGATLAVAPVRQPWGQLVAFLHDPDGLLIEVCGPVGG
ncbi:VOC family protein [Tistrella mobilis]|uniref:VOC family protein n=1 Tax=Tistrella mobilis TaxID=171437 RepID=UPI003558A15B